ncbi:SEC-C domain-containing protein [Brevundimonas sp.]|uniref:SEC-C domain-containing protein n=1 Tax=Brevundimonas sp. TaxID=1871086 RepID=UPI00273112E3|nr:SEC-C domain-containing protein [Brevundimonas sp.]MDP1912051.1 SEC-C domain-containing protein [Brevundimonas sp.]
MAIARNAPCPCGSGKKYKQCCLDADADKARQRMAATAVVAASRLEADEEDAELALLSNEAVDLVNAGDFAKAEAVIAQLRERFPYAHDWMERTAFLNEKRGNLPVAREYYGKCLELAVAKPEFFDEGSRAFFRRKVEQFQPPAAST